MLQMAEQFEQPFPSHFHFHLPLLLHLRLTGFTGGDEKAEFVSLSLYRLDGCAFGMTKQLLPYKSSIELFAKSSLQNPIPFQHAAAAATWPGGIDQSGHKDPLNGQAVVSATTLPVTVSISNAFKSHTLANKDLDINRFSTHCPA